MLDTVPRSELEHQLARYSPAGLAYVHSGGLDPERQGALTWIPAAHLILIAQAVVRLTARIVEVQRMIATGELPPDTQGPRLMVFMPPRHGKSNLISKYVPAWFLGNNPDLRVILASYGATLAEAWGRQARDVLLEAGPSLFGVKVDQRSAAAKEWGVEGHAGGMVSAGVGGGITGKGAHLFIVDDPVKDSEEAASETMQQKTWEWWQGTARTRLMPGAGVIVLQTRWHELDLSGQLLANDPSRDAEGQLLPDGEKRTDVEGEEWEVLNLPAICEEEGDELGRAIGDPLWPAFYGVGSLEVLRKAVGAYFWAALYQQRPAPLEGGLFKRADFRYFREVDDVGYQLLDHNMNPAAVLGHAWAYKLMTCDTALSEKETADFTVLALWGIGPNAELLLLDVERVKFEQPDVQGLIQRTWEAWGKPDLRVESKAHGLALMQNLVREGLPVRPLEADTDKVTRAMGAVPRYEANMVFHRVAAPWLPGYERELMGFPNGAHDDQVDVFAYAALALPGIQAQRRKPRGQVGGTHNGGLRDAPL